MQKHKLNTWSIFFMILGNILMAMGIAAFKLSRLGNDPCNGMYMALADVVGIPYANMLIICNLILLVIEFLFGRHYIGIGTFFNALLLGYIVTFFYNIYTRIAVPQALWQRLLTVLIGLVITGIGLAVYQKVDAGTSPFDSLSLIMTERFRFPYFACRMATDLTALVICFAAGGIVNVGTVSCVLLLGPVADFFDRQVIRRITKNA